MLRHADGKFERLFQAFFRVGADNDTINNQFNGVAFIALDLHLFFHLSVLSVNADAEKPFEQKSFEKFAVMTFASGYER